MSDVEKLQELQAKEAALVASLSSSGITLEEKDFLKREIKITQVQVDGLRSELECDLGGLMV